jgi:hypothetical protein
MKVIKNLKSTIISNYVWHKRKKRGLVPIMWPEQIRERGHRNYVGAKWDILGKLQLDFLVQNGLQPHHVLYDIACGSLRAGIHLIPYLNRGNYVGIEKEELLIELGIEKELGQDIYSEEKA